MMLRLGRCSVRGGRRGRCCGLRWGGGGSCLESYSQPGITVRGGVLTVAASSPP